MKVALPEHRPGWLQLPARARLRQWQRSPRWRDLPLLDRWLLQELLGPLLFGIAAFTAVSLSVGVVFELVRRVAESGLPVLAAVKVLMLRLPSFLVLSFPMATLMATLLAYSRLSGNSELTALRSVGVSTRRMVLPAMALALVMSLLTFVFNDVIVPRVQSRGHEQPGARPGEGDRHRKERQHPLFPFHRRQIAQTETRSNG